MASCFREQREEKSILRVSQKVKLASPRGKLNYVINLSFIIASTRRQQYKQDFFEYYPEVTPSSIISYSGSLCQKSNCYRGKKMEIILALLFTVVLGFVVKHIFFPFRNVNEPPCIRGCIPWFGAAFKFGKAPLEFIKQARLKVITVGARDGEGE